MLTRDNAEPSHRFQTPLLNVTSRQCRFIVSEYPGCDLLRIPDIGNIELVSMA
jgi:hypothetical protein